MEAKGAEQKGAEPWNGRDEDALVRAHLALVDIAVAQVANRVPGHVTRADLVSAGMLGLAQAARSFDAERGISFGRYAANRIRGAVLDELRDRDWATRSVRVKARKVEAATEELTNILGRSPTRDEVARRVGMEIAAVDALADDVHRASLLNFEPIAEIAQSADGEDALPCDLVSPETVILDRERKAYLVDAVAALPDRLRRVIVGYFFEDRPMAALADELDVSESRISQLRAEALRLLREGIVSQLDPDDLPAQRRTGPRLDKRRDAYYESVAAGSDYRSRLDPVAVHRSRLLRSPAVDDARQIG